MTDTRIIDTVHPDEHVAVLRLLQQLHLPIEGLDKHWAHTLVARRQTRVVGSAALEVYADGVLLRSVAVADEERGHGLGQELTQAAVQRARELGSPAVYLLTTTAERFFPKFGFEHITRGEVPASVQVSVEFSTACPSTATVMRKRL